MSSGGHEMRRRAPVGISRCAHAHTAVNLQRVERRVHVVGGHRARCGSKMPTGATPAPRRTSAMIACSISDRLHATRALAPGGVTPSWRIWLRAHLSTWKSAATRCVHAGSGPSSSTSHSPCFLPEEVPESASIAVAKSTSASAGRARSAPAWKYLRAAVTTRCGSRSDATTSATSRSSPASS
jgi:hypothetical protein